MAHILLIDDDPGIRQVAAALLRQAGYEVTVVADADLGLQAYRARQPDLVITDVVMPDRDGIEVILALRGQPTPILAISGYGARGLDLSGDVRLLGAVGLLEKPFTRDELLAAVRAALEAPGARSAVPPGTSKSPAAAASPPTVLLVDDDELVRVVCARALCEAGFAVLEAASAETALDLVCARPIDLDLSLVVADSGGPGVNAPRFAEQLRACHPATPILHISGDAGTLSAAAVAGQRVLPKPFSPDELVSTVQELVRRDPR
jgi:DNA-binding response OmpR family regulator